MAFPIDLSGIGGLFTGIQDAIGVLLSTVQEVFDDIHTFYPRASDLIASIVAEVDAWKDFRHTFAASFKNRVINVESVAKKLRGILTGLQTALEALKDIRQHLRKPDPVSPSDLGKSRNPIVKAIGKILDALEAVSQFVVRLTAILEDLEKIVDAARGIRLAVENLDSIFLSQKNPRERVRLAGGGSIRIRVGSLH